MGYKKCLEQAGCKVIDFKSFGSYQGTWMAFVEYKGEKGIVSGSFGSCSYCDAFQAEFGYSNGHPIEKDGKYYRSDWENDEEDEISQEDYKERIASYTQKMVEFGERYLRSGLENQEYYQRKLDTTEEDDWFGQEEKEFCHWALNQNWK